MQIPDTGTATGEKAVNILGKIAKEKEHTKRWSLVVALTLGMFSGLILVFAPAGREVVSYTVASITGIICLGCLGYSSIKIKTKFLELWTKK